MSVLMAIPQKIIVCRYLFFVFFTVFLDSKKASQVFIRAKRANSLFEEMKPGNLERECLEEICDNEEAREVFEVPDKTVRKVK